MGRGITPQELAAQLAQEINILSLNISNQLGAQSALLHEDLLSCLSGQSEELIQVISLINNYKQKAYPNQTDGVQLETESGSWTQAPAFTEIVPAGTITKDFAVLGIYTTKLDASNKEFQVDIYTGGAGSEQFYCTVLSSIIENEGGDQGDMKVYGQRLEAGTRISAKASDSSGSDAYLDVKILYTEFDV
jgi:hypothetical protein